MSMPKFALASTLSFIASVAFAQSTPLRDLSVEQTSVAQSAAPRPGSLRVTLSADRADATYAMGEAARLTIASNEDVYVTVFDVGPGGKVTQLFPNQRQTDNRVLANRPVEIAGGATGARIIAAGSAGTELIKVIASNKPIAVTPESRLLGQGLFRDIEGGAKALTRDLQVTADAAARPDTQIAFSNFALYTIPSRASATPATSGLTITVQP